MVKQFLSDLIKFRTLSSDFSENGRALSYIQKKISRLPVLAKRFSFNGVPSLYVSTRATKRPRLLLQAHADVVDAGKKMFEPVVVKDRLYGRGAFDMKFAIAAYMELFMRLGKNLKRYDMGILITCDEEVGGDNGVLQFVRRGFLPAVCVLPDGGENWTMQRGAKGTWQLTVTSKGVSAHGSRPWAGRNAVSELMRFLMELERRFPKEPCGNDSHEHNTCNIGYIRGGLESNKIPDFAEAGVDIRHIPKTTKADLRAMVRMVCRSFPGIHVAERLSGEAYALPVQDRYIKIFSALLEQSLGKKTEFIVSHGSSDARYFAAKGVPVVLTRPVGGGHHTEREWISVSGLELFCKILEQYASSVAVR